jgi:PAS domain S-box-containing protein
MIESGRARPPDPGEATAVARPSGAGSRAAAPAPVAEQLPDIVFSAGPEGRWEYLSPRWTERTGRPADPAGWVEAVHAEDRPSCRTRWQAAVRTLGGFEAELRLADGHGGHRWHLVRARLLRDAEGRPSGWAGAFTDIDDLKRAQAMDQAAMMQGQAARAEAEAANRAKDEFLAMISHELRTPLGAILIWSQLLRNEQLDEAGTSRALGMIERSTKTLAKLIDDLLDVSRIIAGKLQLDARPVQLGPVVDAAFEAAQPDAAARGVRLEKALPPEPLTVHGDPMRLQQVVGNLLSNGIKFTPEHGLVQVRLEAADMHARIQVRDSGSGINPQFLPYIFERFRQADSTSTRRNKGLGLGLAISRHLVELHGGTIEASSPGEDQGSTFTVTMPLLGAPLDELTPAPAVRPERWPAEGRVLEGLRVLVVDDEGDARDALALVLERCGAEVMVAGSAAEAFEAWHRQPCDVLLSDIAMPGEDGYSLIRRLSAQGAVAAAAVTAYATSEDRRRALQAGYRAHLTKPVDPTALVATVADLAGRPMAADPAYAPPAD